MDRRNSSTVSSREESTIRETGIEGFEWNRTSEVIIIIHLIVCFTPLTSSSIRSLPSKLDLHQFLWLFGVLCRENGTIPGWMAYCRVWRRKKIKDQFERREERTEEHTGERGSAGKEEEEREHQWKGKITLNTLSHLSHTNYLKSRSRWSVID